VFVRVRKDILIRLWILIGILILAYNALGARSVDEQVKMLAERYRQVEDQLARSIRYTSKDESPAPRRQLDRNGTTVPRT